MLNENLKAHRKSKGLSQEELAIRLNVVRQTISKWEKGRSVPDAALLIRIAEIFEVSVSELLGSKTGIDMDDGKEANIIAEHLSRINEQLAIRNHRSRRVWKIIMIIIAAIVAIKIILVIIGVASFTDFQRGSTITREIESELVLPED